MNECEYGVVSDTNKIAENDTKFMKWMHKPFVRQMALSSCMWASYFQIGLFYGALPVLVAQLRREPLGDGAGAAIDDERASWISSVSNLAAIPCVALLAAAGARAGRRPAALLVVAAAGASFALLHRAASLDALLLSLALQGPLLGGSTNICVLMGSECIAPKYRGYFLSVYSPTMYWAIWTANAIGTFFHWKNIAILGIVCAAYNTSLILFCPESPYWLASKGKITKCREAHRWLRGTGESAEKELECLIESESERSRQIKENVNFCQRLTTYVKQMLTTEFYKPLGLCTLLTIMFFSSGKFVLSVYAIDIIKKITVSESAAYTAMLAVDGVTVLGMYIGSVVSRYTKRRTLFFFTEFVAIFFLFTISGYIYLIKLGCFEENAYFSISLLLAFSLSVSSGPIILYNPLVGELLPLKLRMVAASLHRMAISVVAGTTLKLTPWMFSSLGTHGAFLYFALASLTCALLLLKYLPETKNKTLEEIESLFKGKANTKEMKESSPLTEPACAETNDRTTYTREVPPPVRGVQG